MESSAAPTRCPRCGAAVPPQAPWCTLCLASTRHPAQPGRSPSVGAAPSAVPVPRSPALGEPGFDPLTAPAEALGLPPRRPPGAAPTGPPTGPPVGRRGARPLRGGEASASWPCSACGNDNPLTAGVCGACGSAFLSGVRKAEGPLLELPVVGDITRLQRGQRLGLAFVVMSVIVVLAGLLMLLLS